MGEIRWLDCTLRDGGYYNNWDFSDELVQDYLSSVQQIGVDYIELGFRTSKNIEYAGPFLFTDDLFLDSLEIKNNARVGVMVNGSEFLGIDNVTSRCQALFPRYSVDSKVDIIRFACHYSELNPTLIAAEFLKSRGYEVGINLMQISTLSPSEILAGIKIIPEWVDVFYFADSLGNMTGRELEAIVKLLQSEWKGALGFHSHDNIGMALANVLKALELGVTWVDSTVSGMGRGAGNAATEQLLPIIKGNNFTVENGVPLVSCIKKHFQPLKAQFDWGPNIAYSLGARLSVHPSYIQDLLVNNIYSDNEVIEIIFRLSKANASRYKKEHLEELAADLNDFVKDSTVDLTDIFNDREVFLISSFIQQSHIRRVVALAKEKDALICSVNASRSLTDCVDYIFCCNLARLRVINSLEISPERVITPLAENISAKTLKFPLKIGKKGLQYNKAVIELPFPDGLLYALGVLTLGRSKHAYLVGFEGYRDDTVKRELLNEALKTHLETGGVPIISLCQTEFALQRKSLFGALE